MCPMTLDSAEAGGGIHAEIANAGHYICFLPWEAASVAFASL